MNMAARCRVLGFLHLGENSPTILQISLTGLAQINAARRTREQLCAYSLLQRRDRSGDAGRRQTQTPRRRRKTLLLGDSSEDLHFLEAVHGTVLISDR
ncbi:hypothetical protein D3C76_1066450 [compost metagenome]